MLQIIPDQSGGLYCVRTGRQIDADRDRRLPVDAAFDVLVLGAELDPGDIADAQQRAVGVGAQHDVAELLGRRQSALGLDIHLELLIVTDRARADPANRRLDILRLDCIDHVGRRQLQIVEALSVEPDAHGIVEPTE